MIKFGFQQPSHSGPNSFERVKEVAHLCEAEGYDSFWVMDHLIQIDLAGKIRDPILESYTTTSALATTTSKIKVGALCTCNYFRNPALLAKMVATLDHISKGRFWLGIGAGWYEEEARMYGYDFPNFSTRVEMLEETLEIMRGALASKGSFSFRGKHFHVQDLVISPKPKVVPPILIGGESRQILRLVAKYGSACNVFPKGKELEQEFQVLKEECDKVGRKYSSILKTKLATVMLGRNRQSALQKLSKYKPRWISLEEYSQSSLFGSPREIVEEIEEYVNFGLDYLIVNLRGGIDPASVKAFSRDVMRSF